MLCPSLLNLLVLSTLGAVRAAPIEEEVKTLRDSDFSSPNTVSLQWNDFEYAPGKFGTFWGTMREVYDKALEMNPNFTQDMGIDPDIFIHTDENHDVNDEELERRAISHMSPLQKRDKNICGERRMRERNRGARFVEVNNIIRDLRKWPGHPSLPGKSGKDDENCGEVHCNRFSKVEWCNGNDHPVELGKFDDIANAAFLVKTECKIDYTKGNKASIEGKRVHDDGLTVKVVRNDSGKCK